VTKATNARLALLVVAAVPSSLVAFVSTAAAQTTIANITFINPNADPDDAYNGGRLSVRDGAVDANTTPIQVNLGDCVNATAVGLRITLTAVSTVPNTDLVVRIGPSGSDCSTIVAGSLCRDVASFPATTGTVFPMALNSATDVVGDTTCPERDATTLTLTAVLVTDGTTVSGSQKTRTVRYDTAPPAPPLNLASSPAEAAVRLTFDSNPSNTDPLTDEYRYMAGCAPAGAAPSDAGAGGATDAGDAGAGTDAGSGATATVGYYPAPPDGFYPCKEGEPSGSPTLDEFYMALGGHEVRLEFYWDGTAVAPLTNGTAYDVSLQTIDDYFNASAPVYAEDVTPTPTDDFAETYGAAGGREHGGYCGVVTGSPGAAGGMPAWALAGLALGAAAFLAVRRARGQRRRTRRPRGGRVGPAAALVLTPFLLLARASPARAADEAPGLELSSTAPTEPEPESPQHFAFEMKFGPYLPQIDDEFSGKGVAPFAAHFGARDEMGNLLYRKNGAPRVPARVRARFEFDWQVLRFPGGTLAPFAAVGFWNAVGHAFTQDTSGSTPPLDRTISSDKTALILWPWSIGAAVRLDYAAREWNVPLVPYLKAGLNYTFYWVKAGGGSVAEFAPGEKARGGIPGWEVDVGGMFLLDVFDPGATRAFDRDFGVNNSYVFFEWQFGQMDGFGRRMILSDSTWSVGLALEY
jgi:hypothetical protein